MRLQVGLLLLLLMMVGASHESSGRQPTDAWMVIVSTSRFWHNYRHQGNALAVYHTARKLGLSDDHILFMLADDVACDARNPYPGTILRQPAITGEHVNLYGELLGELQSIHTFLLTFVAMMYRWRTS